MYPYKNIPEITTKPAPPANASDYRLLPVNPAWWQSEIYVNHWQLGRFPGIEFTVLPELHFFVRKMPPATVCIVERASGAVVFSSKNDVDKTAGEFLQLLKQFESPRQYIESIRERAINRYFLRHFKTPDGSRIFLKTRNSKGNIIWATLRDGETIAGKVKQKITKVEFLLDSSAFYIANISSTTLYNKRLGHLAVIEPLSGVVLLFGENEEELQLTVRKYVDRIDWVKLRATLTHEIIQDGASPFLPGITHYNPQTSVLQSKKRKYPYLTYPARNLTEFLLKNPHAMLQDLLFFCRNNQIFLNNYQIEWMLYMWNLIKDSHREFVLRKELINEKTHSKKTCLSRHTKATKPPNWFI
jgi:hypothetical protein